LPPRSSVAVSTWSESITDEILKAHDDLDVDYKAHPFRLAGPSTSANRPRASPGRPNGWGALFHSFPGDWDGFGLTDPELEFWLDRAHNDRMAGARDFWQALYRGQAEAFEAGPATIADILTSRPGPSEALRCEARPRSAPAWRREWVQFLV
jgi:hypothetical protein